MTLPRAAGIAAALAAILVAGCGSTQAAAPAPGAGRGARPPLVTSLTIPGGPSWAIVEMGGPRARHNNFWQLVTRPAGTASWRLATPPGVADNGGLVAASPGGAGIFAYSAGGWHKAGPALPAALARRQVSVLKLTTAGRRTTALLVAAAPGGAASLIAAWAGPSGRWTLSAPLPLGGARILSTATGTGAVEAAATAASPGLASAAGVILSTGRAEFTAGPAADWQQLPALPAHVAALVLGPGRQISALAPSGSILTSWHLAAGAVTWTMSQAMKVPVPYGS